MDPVAQQIEEMVRLLMRAKEVGGYWALAPAVIFALLNAWKLLQPILPERLQFGSLPQIAKYAFPLVLGGLTTLIPALLSGAGGISLVAAFLSGAFTLGLTSMGLNFAAKKGTQATADMIAPRLADKPNLSEATRLVLKGLAPKIEWPKPPTP